MSELLQDFTLRNANPPEESGVCGGHRIDAAIGIGANTAIFSFVNGVLLKPLPYSEPERIVRVLEKPPGGGRNGISTLTYLDWQKDNTVFEYMAAQTGGSVTLTGVTEPVQLRGARVSPHYFDIFGIKTTPGRTVGRVILAFFLPCPQRLFHLLRGLRKNVDLVQLCNRSFDHTCPRVGIDLSYSCRRL